MNRAGWDIGRDQTHRLMQIAGIAGAHRGRKPITTRAAKVIDDSPDVVQRDFTADAPNRLWSLRSFQTIYYIPRALGKIVFHLILRMSEPTEGFCYTAFITDVFSRKIVGWGVSSTMHTLGMPLTALKQALFEARRAGADPAQIVHH